MAQARQQDAVSMKTAVIFALAAIMILSVSALGIALIALAFATAGSAVQ